MQLGINVLVGKGAEECLTRSIRTFAETQMKLLVNAANGKTKRPVLNIDGALYDLNRP